jgi:hypothetical protein
MQVQIKTESVASAMRVACFASSRPLAAHQLLNVVALTAARHFRAPTKFHASAHFYRSAHVAQETNVN